MATLSDIWGFNSHKGEEGSIPIQKEFSWTINLVHASKILTTFGNPGKKQFLKEISELPDKEIEKGLLFLSVEDFCKAAKEICKVELMDPDTNRLRNAFVKVTEIRERSLEKNYFG